MSLSNFFRINLPYGLKEGADGSWAAFNREYMPLGYNSTKHQKINFIGAPYQELPIYTKFKGKIPLIAEKHNLNVEIQKDGTRIIFLYDDSSNPSDGNSKKKWDKYFSVIQALSKMEVKEIIDPVD